MTKRETQQNDKRTSALDWDEVRRRLETAALAAERGWALTSEEAARLLRQRARSLARELPRQEKAGEHLEVLEFLLAYETYAVESRYVREVYPLKELTPLPGTAPFVLGIANVRGRILSVIDIKRFFELPEKSLTDLNKLVIIREGGMELGILADAIVGVRSIPAAEIHPSLPTLTDIRADYLRGVTKERIVVLDARKLLSDRKIVSAEETESQSQL